MPTGRPNKYRDEADARKMAYRNDITTMRREPVVKVARKKQRSDKSEQTTEEN